MSKNKNTAFFMISGILSIVFGILACITIFGAIIGIPLIIASNKYFAWAKMTPQELAPYRDSILIWGVVVTILIFPLGVFALIPVFNTENSEQTTNSTDSQYMKQKMDKISKLFELKQQGIITEEDFKKAKEKILND